jgi:hypothetical protein
MSTMLGASAPAPSLALRLHLWFEQEVVLELKSIAFLSRYCDDFAIAAVTRQS